MNPSAILRGRTNQTHLVHRHNNLNHGLHAALTALTLGLWLPVWLALCLFNEGWKSGHNWLLAGKGSVGLARLERLDVSPELRRRLAG